MKKIFIVLIFIILAQPLMASAYFYRSGSDDTSYKQGSGKNQYGQSKTGYGYNIEPLAAYGYVIGEEKPITGNISSLSKSNVVINWETKYIGRSIIEYGLDNSLSDQSSLIYWQQGNQNYSLQNLQCGKLYSYRVSTYDVAGNKNVGDTKQFQTLACQTNILQDAVFDIETSNGVLELTPETSGRTTKRLDYNYQATVGLPEGALPSHGSFSVVESGSTQPYGPSISTGQFSLYEKPITLTVREAITNNNLEYLVKPATIELKYASTRMSNYDADSLRLAYYDEDSRKWEAVPTIINTGTNTIIADITRLGDYRLLASTEGWIPSEIKNDKVYKEYGSDRVYYVTDGIKHYMSDLSVLHSWNIKVGSAETSSALYRMPLGAEQKYRDGSILKVGAATYYFVQDGGKRLIMNKEVFDDLGFMDSWAYPVSMEDIASYADLDVIMNATTKPNNVLIKYKNSNKVYLIEDGKKRWIKSEMAFNENNFRWDRIISVPAWDIYPNGLDVE
ncbi:hypothetical protein ISR92_03135 [Patescibacteria group bacterium]|nr:hypothetical protein [Patescibacteria group bacterium]